MLTVCICTHNPDPTSLERVLEALRGQTLDGSQWELLIVESGCRGCIQQITDLAWKPGAQVLCEDQLGKTFAMALGIREAQGEAVVFVDDDNVLASDYLENFQTLLQSHPTIAIFSAEISPEYAQAPPAWIGYFSRYLAVQSLERDVWANTTAPSVLPVGAGMGVRREVAARFVELLEKDAFLHDFGRSSSSLRAGTDDTIFGWIAFDLGFGCGSFKALRHTHLISAQRLKHSYLRRLAKDITYSHTVLAWHFGIVSRMGLGTLRRHTFTWIRALLSLRPFLMSARTAVFQGFLLAVRDIRLGRIPRLSDATTPSSE